ncbi:MAG: ABC transporter ATP-binding protein [bacterium]|nr:ABC transporter ATP-binding protein [bacterium]
MNEIDVKLERVTKTFGKFHAVRDVSFEISKGEFFSILGPSGCGKTTTLRMISGFEVPSEGSIFVGGELVNDLAPHKRKTNLVFQHLALFPMMNIEENVAFGLQMQKVPKNEIQKRVDAILNVVELQGFQKKQIHQLSGGQKQRVAIARCLVLNPTVLLLDEPLGALDLKLREQMKIELKKIQHRIGTTFIYITHDQGEALVMSNRVAVMNEGCLIQVGSPQELYDRPNDRFVADFIGDHNGIPASVLDVGNELTTCEAEGLQIRSAAGKRFQPGEECQIYIRPEKIELLDGNDASFLQNSFPAVVADIIFEGALIKYAVSISETLPQLTVSVPNVEAGHIFEISAPVRVSWKPENALTL